MIVAAVCVVGNVVLASLAGYALTCMKFRGKKVVMGILLSVLLLPGEVTLTSQYLVIKGMGLANTLAGVAIPGVVGAINVLLMATACRAVPPSVLDAATVDGANTCRRFATSYGPTSRAWLRGRGVLVHRSLGRLSVATGCPQRSRQVHADSRHAVPQLDDVHRST
ncbi:transport system permease [Cutibacterium acnes JCM 18909]|nr:transport system permease [Cutibacterium acnes JCM 18909]